MAPRFVRSPAIRSGSPESRSRARARSTASSASSPRRCSQNRKLLLRSVSRSPAVVEAAAERERLIQPAFPLVELARRREQFRLARVGDGEFRTVAHRLQDREQAIERLLLLAAIAQHLAHLFLLEQQLHQVRAPTASTSTAASVHGRSAESASAEFCL